MLVRYGRIVRTDRASLCSGLMELQFTVCHRIDRKDETNISAELEKEKESTRVSGKDALENRSERTEPKTSKRTTRTDGE